MFVWPERVAHAEIRQPWVSVAVRNEDEEEGVKEGADQSCMWLVVTYSPFTKYWARPTCPYGVVV